MDPLRYFTTRSSGGAYTLPGRYYTSPEVYELESARIFRRWWIFAGPASTIPRPGDFFVYRGEGESVLVTRDHEEGVRAFHNVCRHRGTLLCADEAGRVEGRFQCPYHAWTYDLAGRLVAAPHMDAVEGFRREDFPLRPVPVVCWEGLVFVHLGEPADAFERVFAPLGERIGKWRIADLVLGHREDYTVEANWKLLFQNYSECYHCPKLHPQLNRLTPYRQSRNDLEEGPILGGPMVISEPSRSMTLDGRACAAPLAGLGDDELGRVFYYTVFPSLLLSLLPDYVLLHRLERLGPARTRVVCDWLVHPAALADSGHNLRGAIDFWNVTNRQDWEVCQLAQRGVATGGYQPGPYADMESMLAASDRHYLEELACPPHRSP